MGRPHTAGSSSGTNAGSTSTPARQRSLSRLAGGREHTASASQLLLLPKRRLRIIDELWTSCGSMAPLIVSAKRTPRSAT